VPNSTKGGEGLDLICRIVVWVVVGNAGRESRTLDASGKVMGVCIKGDL
jgi:hypothetical protein